MAGQEIGTKDLMSALGVHERPCLDPPRLQSDTSRTRRYSQIAVVLTFSISSAVAASATVPASYLTALPSQAIPTGIAVDVNGNLMVAGSVRASDAASDSTDAFVAKLSPDGQTRLSYVVLAGTLADGAGPIAVDGAGNAYVAGGTSSPNFPTTPGALQTSINGASTAGFVVKLDPSGKILYSTLFYAAGGQSTTVSGIAVNQAGEVFLTGQTVGGNFPITSTIFAPRNPANTFFVLHLSAGGDRMIYSVGGLGGSSITIDTHSNAYIAGLADGLDPSDLPVSPDAYQKRATFTLCSGNKAFGIPCRHQYVAKIDAGGTKLLFCTFVTGTYEDSPAQVLVDSHGNVYLAGTTGSTDYPTTTGALQIANKVVLPPPVIDPPGFPPFTFSLVLPKTGYVTKLSGDGTHLLYSTLLGGTQSDRVIAAGIDSVDSLYVLARAQSPDFPGLPQAPQRCLPARLHDTPVVVKLDPQGSTILSESVVEGIAPGSNFLGLANNPKGDVDVVSSGPFLARATTEGAGSRDAIACITDQADYSQSGAISPGQLLTIFGSSIGPDAPLSYDATAADLPVVLGGTSILVNGIPAPMMYVSRDQINFIVPHEVAQQTSVTLELTTPGRDIVQRQLPVAALNPSLSTDGVTDYPVCQGMTLPNSVFAAVLNQDGTRNSCNNPASRGSRVTVFLNGAGNNTSGRPGDNPSSNSVKLEATVTDLNRNIVERTVSVPWAPLGVWEVNVRLDPSVGGHTTLSLVVGGTPVREQNVAVWVSQ
jgi:uncharacterized protein (TIGR03437 family)